MLQMQKKKNNNILNSKNFELLSKIELSSITVIFKVSNFCWDDNLDYSPRVPSYATDRLYGWFYRLLEEPPIPPLLHLHFPKITREFF